MKKNLIFRIIIAFLYLAFTFLYIYGQVFINGGMGLFLGLFVIISLAIILELYNVFKSKNRIVALRGLKLALVIIMSGACLINFLLIFISDSASTLNEICYLGLWLLALSSSICDFCFGKEKIIYFVNFLLSISLGVILLFFLKDTNSAVIFSCFYHLIILGGIGDGKNN